MRLLVNAAFNTRSKVGIARYIRSVIPPLANLCEITVLTPDPVIFPLTCKTIRIPQWTRSTHGRLFWTATLALRLRLADYDALLCMTPEVPVGNDTITVAVVHDLTPIVMRHFHRTREKALFWFGLKTLRYANAIITDSQNTKMDLTSRFAIVRPQSISVVHAGPSTTGSAPENGFASQYGSFLLCVGSHQVHKNLTRVVSAFARLQTTNQVKLVLVGGGHPADIARTKAAVDRKKLNDRVVMLEDVAEENLSSLYRNCRVFICASLYEGFGMPVLEALTHGAPVACSMTSSLPEVAGSAAAYFNPESVADISSQVQRLLDDSQFSSELRVRGRQRAKLFSWEEAARSTAQCLTLSLIHI